MKSAILLYSILCCLVSFALADQIQIDFSQAIRDIEKFDKNSDLKLSEDEFQEWDKRKGMTFDYSGYIRKGDVLTLYDSNTDGFLSYEEVIVYETTWRSEEGKVIRGLLLGVGGGVGTIKIQRIDGKKVDIPLSRLDLRSQLKGFGRTEEIYREKWRKLEGDAQQKFNDQAIGENPGNIFAEYRVLISGPNRAGFQKAKEISDQVFQTWQNQVLDFNLRYRDLAVLSKLNNFFATEMATFGSAKHGQRLYHSLVDFWKKQIEGDAKAPEVYLNAACLDQVLSGVRHTLQSKQGVELENIEIRRPAAHRGLKFHPNFVPLLEFSRVFAGLPEGSEYQRDDRLKIEQGAE